MRIELATLSSTKTKIPISDFYVPTDDHVLCKVWDGNYFCVDRCVITPGAQNWERNKSQLIYYTSSTVQISLLHDRVNLPV